MTKKVELANFVLPLKVEITKLYHFKRQKYANSTFKGNTKFASSTFSSNGVTCVPTIF